MHEFITLFANSVTLFRRSDRGFAVRRGHNCKRALCVTKKNMVRVPLCAKTAGLALWLLGSLLLGPTPAMAEYDVKSALQAYDSADSDNRKVWELIFGNTYNGMRWANGVLVQRRQQQIFCEPNRAALSGLQVAEMLHEQFKADPKFGDLPFGFGILIVLQIKFPCIST